MATLDEADGPRPSRSRAGRRSSTSASRPASAAPSTTSRRGTTPTRSSRRCRPRAASTSTAFLESADLVELSRRTYDGIGLETRERARPQRPLPARRQVPARVLHRRRPGRRHPRARERRSEPAVDGHDAARARPRDVRRRPRPVAAVAPARHASRRHRGDRDPDGQARERRRVAASASLGVDPDAVAAIADALRAARAAEMLVFTRWVLVMTNFERSLYADPESDLDARWWELVERYQLVAQPPGRSSPGLGREDPRRLRARLLPHLPLRPHRRLAARGDARARVRRARRPSRGRPAARRAGVRAGPVGALGPADRAGDRRAAERRALRPRHRRRSEPAHVRDRAPSTTSASSRTTSRCRSASTSTSSASRSLPTPELRRSRSSGCAPATASSTSSSGPATRPRTPTSGSRSTSSCRSTGA